MVAGRSVTGRIIFRGFLATLVVGLSMIAAGMSLAEERLRLSIASMDIAGKQIAPIKPEAPAPAWRHTFGSERRSEAVRQPVRISADVVVLQGVTNLAPVRQMFPARTFHLVVSRQILQQAEPADGQHTPIGTTALAIRRDTGLRLLAQDHLLELAEPPPDAAIDLAAATAVRLLSDGRALWVVALDLAQGCQEQDAQPNPSDVRCQAAKRQLDELDKWLAQHMAAGEAVVMAGRFHRQLDTGALPGHIGQMSRFSFSGEPPPSCAAGMETTGILAAPGAPAERQVALTGKLEPVDEAAPEAGCYLLVDAML